MNDVWSWNTLSALGLPANTLAYFAGMILLVHAAATWMMAGVIWFVQTVHYPLFSGVGPGGFAAYLSAHQARTTGVVAPLMLIEMTSGVMLLVVRPAAVAAWLPAVGLGLLALLWVSTFLVQVPCHTILGRGFNAPTHRKLVATNWIRTALWTARAVLVTVMLGFAIVGIGPVASATETLLP